MARVVGGQVREALCELELPYRRLACGKGSKRRPQLQREAGSTQVLFLQIRLRESAGAVMSMGMASASASCETQTRSACVFARNTQTHSAACKQTDRCRHP